MFIEYGKVVMGTEEEILHKWHKEKLEQRARNIYNEVYVLNINTINDISKLEPLRYNNIFEKGSLIVINYFLKTIDSSFVYHLFNIDFSKRMVYLNVLQDNNYKYFHKYLVKIFKENQVGLKYEGLPLPESWISKYNLLSEYIDNMGITFAKRGKVKDTLISRMMHHQDIWDSIKVQLEILAENKVEITLTKVDEIFEDVEYFSLSELTFTIFRGVGVRKRVQMIRYFLSEKEYSPQWMLKFWLKQAETIEAMYRGRMKGAIIHYIDSSTLNNRLNYIQDQTLEPLTQLSNKEIREYFDFTEDVPYPYFKEIVFLLGSKSFIDTTENDLYAILYEIDRISEKYDSKGFQKGFNRG